MTNKLFTGALFLSFLGGSLQANTAKAIVTIDKETFEISNKFGGQYICNWNTQKDPKTFTASFKDDNGSFFIMLDGFGHDLLKAHKVTFDIRKDGHKDLSIARIEKSNTKTSYDLDLVFEEKSNCMVDLELSGLDVLGKIRCTDLTKWDTDSGKLIGSGFDAEGSFRCPYSASR